MLVVSPRAEAKLRGIALPTAPLTPPPARAQVVEDILNHAEEIAVAEEGHAGEVTLLRLLKVRLAPPPLPPTNEPNDREDRESSTRAAREESCGKSRPERMNEFSHLKPPSSPSPG